MSWYYYNDYESVAERRQKAQKKMETLRAAGESIQPIEPFKTRGIATSFWGQAWCRHLEKFSDYESRLPRGRSYVRNGSVCHLGIEPGTVRAYVSGSSLYELDITIQPLDPAKWSTIKNRCTGKIGSLIELLQGKISSDIMAVVTDPSEGLFPHPKEIRFNCNCPDWADMCKHVAAAMYGIGVRLDTQPELLFTLRGVDHAELVSVETAIDGLTAGNRSRRRRTLDSAAVENVFGIDLDGSIAAAETQTPPPPAPPSPGLTGDAIRALRKRMRLSQTAFGALFDLSQGTITKWENGKGTPGPNTAQTEKLEQLFRKNPPA